MAHIPSVEIAPHVGLKPTMPQNEEGDRIEPPVSLPSAIGTQPAPTATPEPLLEPPDTRSGFQGLRAGP